MHDEEAAGTRRPEVHKFSRVGWVKTRVGRVSGNNKFVRFQQEKGDRICR